MSEQHHHITPAKTLIKVGIALSLLTVLTVGVGYMQLPSPYNVIFSIGIAIVKASLVVTFFMNFYWERKKFNIMVFAAAFVFFSIFITLTLLDVMNRIPVKPSF